ncbi:MAG TPA: protein phosphatase 2C domain-containing protein [Lichenihabitans sp.]|jgi:protein phosphatase|nr:protein phosphatase 2C domain-containing protein [Lichenihabitans sp.]
MAARKPVPAPRASRPAPRGETAARPKTWAGALLGARESQQDTSLLEDLSDGTELLALVADGMGGHAAGALASQTVAKRFAAAFLRLRSDPAGLGAALRRALDEANLSVAEAQHGHPDRSGMGTTLIAAHVSPRGLAWISVGDSVLLLCRAGTIRRLNEDHSLRSLPGFTGGRQGNLLRSAITGDELALVDCSPEPLRLEAGDTLVLASDGLLTLSGDEILDLVGKHSADGPEALGAALIEAVNRRQDPKQDNCSVVTVGGFAAPPPPPVPPSRAGLRLLLPLAIVLVLVCAAAAALVW